MDAVRGHVAHASLREVTVLHVGGAVAVGHFAQPLIVKDGGLGAHGHGRLQGLVDVVAVADIELVARVAVLAVVGLRELDDAEGGAGGARRRSAGNVGGSARRLSVGHHSGEGQQGLAAHAGVVGLGGKGDDAVGGQCVAGYRQPVAAFVDGDGNSPRGGCPSADAHGQALVGGAPAEGWGVVVAGVGGRTADHTDCPCARRCGRGRCGFVGVIVAGREQGGQRQEGYCCSFHLLFFFLSTDFRDFLDLSLESVESVNYILFLVRCLVVVAAGL